MAPELLANSTFSKSVDIYALGILMWELFAEHIPWDGLDTDSIKEAVLAGERPMPALSCPAAVTKLCKLCWDGKASARPCADELVNKVAELVEVFGGGRSGNGVGGGGACTLNELGYISGPPPDSLDLLLG